MDENILEVRHLHTDFVTDEKTVQAVNDVSFEIKRGETFGLIGESGCGKSVTCRSLMRLLKEPGQITGGEINKFSKPKVPRNRIVHECARRTS